MYWIIASEKDRAALLPNLWHPFDAKKIVGHILNIYQAGWGHALPDLVPALVVGNSVHGRGVGSRWSLRFPPTQVILWSFYDTSAIKRIFLSLSLLKSSKWQTEGIDGEKVMHVRCLVLKWTALTCQSFDFNLHYIAKGSPSHNGL